MSAHGTFSRDGSVFTRPSGPPTGENPPPPPPPAPRNAYQQGWHDGYEAGKAHGQVATDASLREGAKIRESLRDAIEQAAAAAPLVGGQA